MIEKGLIIYGSLFCRYQQKGKVCKLQIDTRKLKKLIIKAVPYVAFSYVGNLIGFAYRTAEGDGFQEKILPFMSNLGAAFARIFPSLHPLDILFGLVLAGVLDEHSVFFFSCGQGYPAERCA